MNAQVFRGKTVAEAHRAARAKLGLDAVVLTTRPVRRGGIAGLLGGSDVEIAAILPEPVDDAQPTESEGPFARAAYAHPQVKMGDDVAALRAELKNDIRALRNVIAKSDEMPRVASEIAQLRELIEGLAENAPQAGRNDKVAAKLRALGIEGPAAIVLVKGLRKGGGDAALRVELSRIVPVSAFPLTSEKTMIALVGPSGVGKTTTAAKLAARARMVGRTVTLVACDTYRVGGTAQLAQYAKLMGAECVTARTADELRAVIDGSASDFVVVDTSGRPPTADGVEIGIAPQKRSPRATARTRHVLLCLPASIRANDAARVARRFGTLSPTSLAITKIDETDTPAGIVHACWASKLAVSVMCNGQRVPEDIAPANTDALIDFLSPAPGLAAAPAHAPSHPKESAAVA
jgi:flagellar biosynthesis protein FlhF